MQSMLSLRGQSWETAFPTRTRTKVVDRGMNVCSRSKRLMVAFCGDLSGNKVGVCRLPCAISVQNPTPVSQAGPFHLLRW